MRIDLLTAGLVDRLAQPASDPDSEAIAPNDLDGAAPLYRGDRPHPSRPAPPAIVTLRDVRMAFGGKLVLNGVSFSVAPEERLVVIGPSGEGKTTILRLILGILSPTDGAVYFKQRAVSAMSDYELREARTRIGMVFQDAALFTSSTVRENLALPLQELSDKTQAEIDRIVDEKLELVEITGECDAMPSELSGGMRKRVGIARALVMEPELILFDEPTAGLDPVTSTVIDELIINLTERSRVTSIIVTHIMESAFRVSTRMAMLYQGKIIADEKPEEFRRSRNPFLAQFIRGQTAGPISERSRYHMLSPAEPG